MTPQEDLIHQVHELLQSMGFPVRPRRDDKVFLYFENYDESMFAITQLQDILNEEGYAAQIVVYYTMVSISKIRLCAPGAATHVIDIQEF